MGGNHLPSKKTKIVCTIGPASQSQDVLRDMVGAGMNVARINFAHGDAETHRLSIANVRAVAAQTGERVAIMGDLPGPKIRIGAIYPDPLMLDRGQTITLTAGDFEGNSDRVSVQFDRLVEVLNPGDYVYFNDGFIKLQVEEISGADVHCCVLVGGELRSYKGVNLPDIDLGISAFTQNDRKWLAFAAEQRLDAVSQSFVETAEDIRAVREAAREMGYEPFIIAKIERSGALQNAEALLESTDGVMIARGDLGVEIPIEKIAITQKDLILQSNLHAKPVITATHMLESMTYSSRPTRAEATDVANAILDGTDCVMLSGETAIGDNPVAAVSVMADIARATESRCDGDRIASRLRHSHSDGMPHPELLVSTSIFTAARNYDAAAVVTPTLSGHTARMISRFRLSSWIIAVSPNESTCQELQFSFGVHPVYRRHRPANWERFTREWLGDSNVNGDLVLLTEGTGTGESGYSNRLGFIDLTQPLSDIITW